MAKHPPCPPLHRPNRAARPAASAPACYRNRAAVTNGVIAGAAGYIPRQLSRKTGSHLPQTTPRLLPGGGSAASHRPAPRRPHRWRKRHRGNAWRHCTTAALNSVGKRRRAYFQEGSPPVHPPSTPPPRPSLRPPPTGGGNATGKLRNGRKKGPHRPFRPQKCRQKPPCTLPGGAASLPWVFGPPPAAPQMAGTAGGEMLGGMAQRLQGGKTMNRFFFASICIGLLLLVLLAVYRLCERRPSVSRWNVLFDVLGTQLVGVSIALLLYALLHPESAGLGLFSFGFSPSPRSPLHGVAAAWRPGPLEFITWAWLAGAVPCILLVHRRRRARAVARAAREPSRKRAYTGGAGARQPRDGMGRARHCSHGGIPAGRGAGHAQPAGASQRGRRPVHAAARP